MTRIGRYANPRTCPHPVEARVWPHYRTNRHIHQGPPGAIAMCHDCGMWAYPWGWSL